MLDVISLNFFNVFVSVKMSRESITRSIVDTLYYKILGKINLLVYL